MLCWYSNKKVGIYFDDIPKVSIRYYIPSMTVDEKKSIEKYPFICKRDLHVLLKDLKNQFEYIFCIPKGYCYDGASIPRFFWRIIGSNTDNSFLIPALVHDVLCEHHEYVNYDKGFSTDVFNALMECSGINSFKRFFMKNSVAFYQTICCRWK